MAQTKTERTGGRKPLLLRRALAALLALAAVSIFKSTRSSLNPPYGSGDFGMTLKAAQDLKHENPYARYLQEGPGPTTAEKPDAQDNPMGLYPMQMPSSLMLLWPLSPLRWKAAKLAWLLLNLAFSAGSGLLLARRLRRPSPEAAALLASLLLISLPWRIAVANGQHLIAGMFFFLLSAELADKGRKTWAGVALACSFIKYTATFFLLPYFVWKRQWRPIAVALAIHLALTIGVALWLGENPVRLVIQSVQAASSYQPAQGLYQLNDGYIDLFAVGRWLSLPLGIPLAATAVGTALTYWLAIRRCGNEALFLTLLCFWAYVAMYHRAYDAVILLIPLGFALNAVQSRLMPWAAVIGVVTCSWFVDRFVIQFTDWLAPGQNGQQGIYYAVMVAIYYVMLAILFWQTAAIDPDSSEFHST